MTAKKKAPGSDILPPAVYKTVAVALIDPWEDNPRGILEEDFDRLKRQILRLGVYKPLLVYQDGDRYVALGGNMRVRAFKDLGLESVAVSIVSPRTKAEKIAYALSDNDRAGFYQDQQLAELVIPHIAELDLDGLKVDLGKPIDLKGVIESFGPPVDGPAPTEEDYDEKIEPTTECPKCGYRW